MATDTTTKIPVLITDYHPSYLTVLEMLREQRLQIRAATNPYQRTLECQRYRAAAKAAITGRCADAVAILSGESRLREGRILPFPKSR